MVHWLFSFIVIRSKVIDTFWILTGKFPLGNFRENCSPGLKFLYFSTLRHIPLAELHQSSYCLYESVESLKSYGMEYFGWELPLGEFLLITLPKANFNFQGQVPFAELHCLSYRWLKSVELFRSYSTQHLSWKSLFPTQNEGVLGHNSPHKFFGVNVGLGITPQIKFFLVWPPKGTSLA